MQVHHQRIHPSTREGFRLHRMGGRVWHRSKQQGPRAAPPPHARARARALTHAHTRKVPHAGGLQPSRTRATRPPHRASRAFVSAPFCPAAEPYSSSRAPPPPALRFFLPLRFFPPPPSPSTLLPAAGRWPSRTPLSPPPPPAGPLRLPALAPPFWPLPPLPPPPPAALPLPSARADAAAPPAGFLRGGGSGRREPAEPGANLCLRRRRKRRRRIRRRQRGQRGRARTIVTADPLPPPPAPAPPTAPPSEGLLPPPAPSPYPPPSSASEGRASRPRLRPARVDLKAARRPVRAPFPARPLRARHPHAPFARLCPAARPAPRRPAPARRHPAGLCGASAVAGCRAAIRTPSVTRCCRAARAGQGVARASRRPGPPDWMPRARPSPGPAGAGRLSHRLARTKEATKAAMSGRCGSESAARVLRYSRYLSPPTAHPPTHTHPLQPSPPIPFATPLPPARAQTTLGSRALRRAASVAPVPWPRARGRGPRAQAASTRPARSAASVGHALPCAAPAM